MDPLKEIGRKQKAMDKGAYQDALNRPINAIQQSTPYRLADLIMNGEDADIGMAESLIPTVSLQKKLAQGKLPGLADIMDIPNPLSAMAPIGYGLKELRAGARLGKTLRNIEKAKEARDFVHRIHRTHVKDANSIEDKGLLVGKDNPNYSRNTGDTHLYPPSVWMGVDPTNVPVMQHYFTQQGDKGIDKTRTFSIRIPRDVYNERQRVKWEGGRSGTPVVVSGKGNASLSPETARWTGNQTKIDMMVGSIPKEWLSRIPQKKIHEMVDSRNMREAQERVINSWLDSRNDPRSVDEIKERVYGGDQLSDKLNYEERALGGNLDLLEDAIERSQEMPSELYDFTPNYVIQQALDELGSTPIGGEIPYGTKLSDLVLRDVNADGIPANKIHPANGHISRGETTYGDHDPRDRIFNWNDYSQALKKGFSPFNATLLAQPNEVFDINWPSMYKRIPAKQPPNGHISRGVDNAGGPRYQSWVGMLKEISESIKDDNSISNKRLMGEGLKGLLKNRLDESGYNLATHIDDPSLILEKIGTSVNPTLSRLRDLEPSWNSSLGAVGRGNVPTVNETLPEAYRRFYDMHSDDDLWWIDPESPDAAEKAHEYFRQEALKDLQEYMRDATDYIPDDPVRITPFVHLRDVHSKIK